MWINRFSAFWLRSSVVLFMWIVIVCQRNLGALGLHGDHTPSFTPGSFQVLATPPGLIQYKPRPQCYFLLPRRPRGEDPAPGPNRVPALLSDWRRRIALPPLRRHHQSQTQGPPPLPLPAVPEPEKKARMREPAAAAIQFLRVSTEWEQLVGTQRRMSPCLTVGIPRHRTVPTPRTLFFLNFKITIASRKL